jgi:protein-S-isoprenylcysteine O-methyltransferase Ste14
VRRAVLGSVLFFVVGPCLEAGLGPWLLTRWERGDGAFDVAVLRVLGAVLLVAGLAVLVHAFAGFAREGRGTPAPVAPPDRLVVRGAYRHVRNPMYVATAAAIAGQGLLLARPVLLGAAALYCATLGAQYDAYRGAVPGWVPRLRPWDPPAAP